MTGSEIINSIVEFLLPIGPAVFRDIISDEARKALDVVLKKFKQIFQGKENDPGEHIKNYENLLNYQLNEKQLRGIAEMIYELNKNDEQNLDKIQKFIDNNRTEINNITNINISGNGNTINSAQKIKINNITNNLYGDIFMSQASELHPKESPHPHTASSLDSCKNFQSMENGREYFYLLLDTIDKYHDETEDINGLNHEKLDRIDAHFTKLIYSDSLMRDISKQEIGILYNNMSALHFRWSNYKKALSYIESAIKSFKESKLKEDKIKLARAKITLGVIYLNIGDRKQSLKEVDDAIKDFNNIMICSNNINNSSRIKTYAECLINSAFVHMYNGNNATALEEANTAYTKLEELYNKHQSDEKNVLEIIVDCLVIIEDRLGALSSDKGLESLHYYEEAVKYLESKAQKGTIYNKNKLAIYCNNLGNKQQRLGMSKACETCNKAIDIYSELIKFNKKRYTPELAISYNGLSNVWEDFQEPEKALECSLQALKYYGQLVSIDYKIFASDLAWTHNNCGDKYKKLNKNSDATIHYLYSILLYHECTQDNNGASFTESLLRVLYNLASMVTEDNSHDHAIRTTTFKLADKIYKDKNRIPENSGVVKNIMENFANLLQPSSRMEE